MIDRELEFHDFSLAQELFGPQEKYLKFITDRLGVEIYSRGAKLFLSSKEQKKVDIACNFLIQMYEIMRHGFKIHPSDYDYALTYLENYPSADLGKLFKEKFFTISPRKTICPKSIAQKVYLDAIKNKEIVFAIGPAGTGKTYLAVAMAVSFLLQKKVKRLILTRPALEAGEKLGFLPGDILEKVDPYLRPLYDALHDMLDFKKVQELMDAQVIEVAPLAFMRGRTLNKAFIILDEAQNTTSEQMKMFLTRLGSNSRAVITGDVTQIDLSIKEKSGLIEAEKVLKGIEGIEFVYFSKKDVIRHKLVGEIIDAYERYENKHNS